MLVAVVQSPTNHLNTKRVCCKSAVTQTNMLGPTPTAASSKPLEYLVLDAGALIRGHGLSLYHKAKKVVTVPDVLMEIRDSKSRELLEKLPFEIEERMPSQSSINAVAQFAKKTGDYAAISKTDLRLIALTHMLEIELNGKKYLNELAGKMEISSISAQLEKAKQSGKEEETSSEAPKPASEVRAPVSKPNIWATKSWATVLAGESAAPAAEGAVGSDVGAEAAAVAETTTGDDDVAGAAADEVISEGEEDSGDEDEEDEDADSQGSQESDAEIDDQRQESAVEVDHFTGAVQDVAQVLQECGLGEEASSPVPEEEHIVAGFDEDCGCGATAEHTHDHSAATATASPAKVAASTTSSNEPYHTRMMRPTGLASGNNAESQRLRLEDDGVGWVNSSNLLQQRGKGGYTVSSAAARKSQPKTASTTSLTSASVSEVATEEGSSVAVGSSAASKKKKPKKRPTKVACLTTDFAMQNVMMQMDLRVMSVDGLMIKTARQWVLRCMGCFEVHYEMDRLFCRKCGGHHLSRVSASVDAGGELKLHLKKNYHVELRGTKYSLPAPGKQGRYQGEILLREDQLLQGIWKQKCVKIRKDIKSAFGEDVTSDVGMHINKGQAIKIGMGKQNVNAAKGRERRGKSKAHTVK